MSFYLNEEQTISGKCLDVLDKLETLIQGTRTCLNNDPSNSRTLLQSCTEKVTELQTSMEQIEKKYNSKLNKLSKEFEKKCPNALDKVIETNGVHVYLPMLLADHYVRIGDMELAKAVKGVNFNDWDDYQSAEYSEACKLLNLIMERFSLFDLKPAIEWAKDNHDILMERGSNLTLLLHKFECLHILMETRDPVRCMQYCRKNLTNLQGADLSELQSLFMSFLLVPKSPNVSDDMSSLQEYIGELDWDRLKDTFTSEYCKINGLPVESPLQTVLDVGTFALTAYIKFSKISSKNFQPLNDGLTMPMDIDLPEKYRYHSLFICPVSKQQSTADNPPMLLACGHAISKNSMLHLTQNSHRKCKCPYCPIETNPSDAMQLYF
ncbi:ubiquitin-protein ligase E3 [Schizosaccharomyces japonicus yFS275]|uniref:GID complex catalytic subunit 2 n=1 Tax=Schizosaccharomyces japonicus (strain yFS275 / FY16936) TaxID=402676 RepID=B6JYH5_SCHJY|nr:ubiquitin-protein ligase E3 [Schizosaccharomyces japonicus yFS275]EEB06593.1 ubiquitin-protein ligase E3 [Schizosaccharomyces japonicus yFS275]